MWRMILAWMAAAAADPAAQDAEWARSSAAVSAAYASVADEASPDPDACGCAGKCTGGRYQPDGRIWQKCSGGCACGCKEAGNLSAEKCGCSAESGQKGGR